ncbi:sigma D regulator [Larsenimonas rhizosphaerae]|uniref:Sigma D regulator n=1 Tax=Larsenimonas rhizosphaerae TaxID=2944682 RepID=A0AA42CY73_9GAMM|nr:sigma D regulator [Larsenimonas rhizosphaerae]MCM2131896.1 sigma D regulator [Larsenimonas rhizosphaerae]MCX2524798.1 sigma D regulator [Larsenimonas rhizosphaerae]
MLKQWASARECWGGVHTLIDRWLEQRGELLEHYAALERACDSDLEIADRALVDRFGEALVDYVSTGHFELYPRLCEECRLFDDEAALQTGHLLLENMDPSTQLALDFNDAYADETSFKENRLQITAWLDRLARVLKDRFALEDVLIARLHADHADVSDKVSG